MYNCFDTNEEYFWEDLKRTVIQLLFYALLLSGWFFGMISFYWIIIAFFLKKTLIPNYNIAQKARKVINTFLSWSGIEKKILEFIQSFTSSKYMYLRTINVIFLPEPYQFRLFSPSEILSNDKTTFSIKGIKTILKQTNGDLKKIDENKLLNYVIKNYIPTIGGKQKKQKTIQQQQEKSQTQNEKNNMISVSFAEETSDEIIIYVAKTHPVILNIIYYSLLPFFYNATTKIKISNDSKEYQAFSSISFAKKYKISDEYIYCQDYDAINDKLILKGAVSGNIKPIPYSSFEHQRLKGKQQKQQSEDDFFKKIPSLLFKKRQKRQGASSVKKEQGQIQQKGKQKQQDDNQTQIKPVKKEQGQQQKQKQQEKHIQVKKLLNEYQNKISYVNDKYFQKDQNTQQSRLYNKKVDQLKSLIRKLQQMNKQNQLTQEQIFEFNKLSNTISYQDILGSSYPTKMKQSKSLFEKYRPGWFTTSKQQKRHHNTTQVKKQQRQSRRLLHKIRSR